MVQVWAGPLSGGRKAVVLWNRAIKPDTVTLTWADVGLDPETPVMIRDLWKVRAFSLFFLFFFSFSFRAFWSVLCFLC